MANSFKADEYIDHNGAQGIGTHRAYDKKTGKHGYVNESSGYFIPDEKKKSIFDSEPDAAGQASSRNWHTGAVIDEGTSPIMAIGGTLAVFAAIVGGVGLFTYLYAKKKNPDDSKGAMNMAARNASCTGGIIIIIAIMIASAIICFAYNFLKQPANYVSDIILFVIELVCLLNLIGLIRIMMGNKFLVTASEMHTLTSAVKKALIPKWVNWVIIIGSIVLLFKPIFFAINGQTASLAERLMESPVIVTGLVVLGMALMAVIGGAIPGVIIVCLLKVFVKGKE